MSTLSMCCNTTSTQGKGYVCCTPHTSTTGQHYASRLFFYIRSAGTSYSPPSWLIFINAII